MRWFRKSPFNDLYREHAREIYDWFRARTPDHETAADLTAETFARGLERYGRVRDTGDRRTAIAWIYGIASNVLREYRRHLRVDSSVRLRLGMATREGIEQDDLDRRIAVSGDAPMLTRALAELPEDQRVTLRLRIVDELGYREIAQRLSCSEPAARQRVARALAALKLEMEGTR